MESVHKTVLLQETIDGLNLQTGAVVIDATFGGGGHSMEICKRFPTAKIIALDQDKNAFKNLPNNCSITFHNTNFRNLDKVLKKEGVEKIDAIIFDLGLSSDQLENSNRGFSFLKDEPLLMTMKANPEPADLTASDIVNTWSEKSLADIIYGYGEERFAKRIARRIVERRKKGDIKTSFDLVEVIKNSVPTVYKRGKLHVATKTFQALRIAVNDELGALKEGLEKGFDVLKVGGRISVISFHSLEDRIVKKFFKQKEKEGKVILIPALNATPARNDSHSDSGRHSVAGGNKKLITPSIDEIRNNPRARSAKLRIIKKIK